MKKFINALIGGTVLLTGIALLVLPGPGLVIIAGGLAILATEFVWAKRALQKARKTAARAGRKSGLYDWWVRRRRVRSEMRRTCGPRP